MPAGFTTLNIRYLLAFIAIMFLMHEGHEWAHILAIKINCGCWPKRNFTDWVPCGNCTANNYQQFAIYMAAPLFNFLMIWIGFGLYKHPYKNTGVLGITLVFANLPQLRWLGALTGGCNELTAFKFLFSHSTARWLTLILVTAACYPFFKIVVEMLQAKKWFQLILLLVVTPIIYLEGLQFVNVFLKKFGEAIYWWPMQPAYITLFILLMIVLLLLNYKSIFTKQLTK